ncbi:MAG: hypothetical protein AAGJ73_03035 [Pseudomonadota bacterium]
MTLTQKEERDEKKSRARRGRIGRAIAGAAPKLANALGGPLAGAAVSALARAIFGTETVSEEELEAALATASPEQLIALKKADYDFRVALRMAAVEEERVHASDRDSARRRQQLMDDWAPSVLGVLIIFGFFIVLAAMLTQRLPDGAETEFSIMLGALATMTAAVVNYFFGSSAGSREKTRLLSPAPGGVSYPPETDEA